MDFLCRKKRETFAEVITHLITEHALCAGSGAVGLHCSVFTDVSKQFQVLFHNLGNLLMN